MRRFLFCLVAVLSLASCGGAGPAATPTPTVAPPAPTSSPSTPAASVYRVPHCDGSEAQIAVCVRGAIIRIATTQEPSVGIPAVQAVLVAAGCRSVYGLEFLDSKDINKDLQGRIDAAQTQIEKAGGTFAGPKIAAMTQADSPYAFVVVVTGTFC